MTTDATHFFTDALGRTWALHLSMTSVDEVRVLTELDLLDEISGTYKRLTEEIRLLCGVLYVLVKPQADEAGVSEGDFGQGLSGDVLDEALHELTEAIIDFFPQGKRDALRDVVAKMKSMLAKAQDVIRDRLASDEVDVAFQREINRLEGKFSESLESLLNRD